MSLETEDMRPSTVLVPIPPCSLRKGQMRENENKCRKMPAVGKFMETPKSGDEEVIPPHSPGSLLDPRG